MKWGSRGGAPKHQGKSMDADTMAMGAESELPVETQTLSKSPSTSSTHPVCTEAPPTRSSTQPFSQSPWGRALWNPGV